MQLDFFRDYLNDDLYYSLAQGKIQLLCTTTHPGMEFHSSIHSSHIRTTLGSWSVCSEYVH